MNLQFNKLNATYFGLREKVAGYNKTRDVVVPLISSTKAKNKASQDNIDHLTNFYKKYQSNRHISEFIAAANADISYDKYDYRWRDPKASYEYRRKRHYNTEVT